MEDVTFFPIAEDAADEGARRRKKAKKKQIIAPAPLNQDEEADEYFRQILNPDQRNDDLP